MDAAPALVRGHVDGIIDRVEWRVDEGAWQDASGAPVFFVYLPAMDPGPHLFEVRSVLENRTSPPSMFALDVEDATPLATPESEKTTPWAAFVALGILALLLLPLLLRIRK